MTQDVQENNKNSLFAIIISVALLAYFIQDDPGRFLTILTVGLGFGGIIFVHELGHFVAAKAVGIRVEAFAVGFGPVAIGFRQVVGGVQMRLFPKKLPDNKETSAFSFTFKTNATEAGETEYQLRIIPLGGFVAMVGQSDIGADDASDDPRSYANKTVSQRMLVISAGVIVNIITGFIAFVLIFNHGIEKQPAVVGDMLMEMPAYQAGIRPGDEIIAIDGKDKHVEFIDIRLASVFSDNDEKIHFTVKHPDNTIDEYHIAAHQARDENNEIVGLKTFGLASINSLTVFDSLDKDGDIVKKISSVGIYPGDTVSAINNTVVTDENKIEHMAHLATAFTGLTDKPERDLAITLKHNAQYSDIENTTLHFPYKLSQTKYDTEWALAGMTPCLQVFGFAEQTSKRDNAVIETPAQVGGMKENDTIIGVGNIKYPTRKAFIKCITDSNGEAVQVTVVRNIDNKQIEKTLSIKPELEKRSIIASLFKTAPRKPKIGIIMSVDFSRPVVALTTPLDSSETNVPRGATITAINGVVINNWADIYEQFKQHQGEKVKLTYDPINGDSTTVSFSIPTKDWSKVSYSAVSPEKTANLLPNFFKRYEVVYQGETWKESIQMGTEATGIFLAQTYLTIQKLLNGQMKAKGTLSGPVGILSTTYDIVEEKPLVLYFWFLAVISMAIATFNFLPLPILDGGLFVLLIVEKIKGSPVSVRAQEIINYAGLLMIGSLFLYVTFNDIGRFFN